MGIIGLGELESDGRTFAPKGVFQHQSSTRNVPDTNKFFGFAYLLIFRRSLARGRLATRRDSLFGIRERRSFRDWERLANSSCGGYVAHQ